MTRRRLWQVALALGLAGCGDDVSASIAAPAPADPGGAFQITPAKTTYTWEELAFTGTGLVATVKNRSGTDWYANVGDAFNGALEQPQISIANGTDAALELRGSDGSWSALDAGVLVEGSRFVVLRAGKQYELRGNFSGARRTGTARVRFRYWPSASATGTPVVEYSASFTVR